MRYIVLMAMIITSFHVSAQLSCTVTTAKGEPIAFANVYLPAYATGTVTEADGTFILDYKSRPQPDVAGAAKVRFSCIGYVDREIALNELIDQQNEDCSIELEEKKYVLAQAEVKAKGRRYSKRLTLGIEKRNEGVSVMCTPDDNPERGMEIGNIMKTKKDCRIEKIGLNINSSSKDTLHYEVNVYEYDGIKTSEIINSERIFWDIPQSATQSTIELDVSEHNLYTSGSFFVSLETLDPIDSTYLVSFSGKLFKRMTLFKGGDGEWTKVPFPVSVGLYSEVTCAN